MQGKWTAYQYWLLAAILIGCSIFSLVSLIHNPPSLNTGDADQWWNLARNIADGKGYTNCVPNYFPFCKPGDLTAAREPAPVFLFAIIIRFAHDSLWAGTSAMLVLHLATTVGLFFLTRRLTHSHLSESMSVALALIAAALWAMYIPVNDILHEISGELLATCSVVWATYLVYDLRPDGRNRRWAIAGALFALSALSRSSMLILGLVIVGTIFLQRWIERSNTGQRAKQLFAAPLACLAAMALLYAPWLARNSIAFNHLIAGSTLTGYNLFRQNNTLAQDTPPLFVGPEASQAVTALIARRTDLSGKESEAEMDVVYRSEALNIIRAHPTGYLLLSAARFIPLWFDYGVEQAYGNPYDWDEQLVAVENAIILLLMVIGWLAAKRIATPLVMGIVIYSMTYMLVIARMRYAVAIMPLVLVVAMIGAGYVVQCLSHFWHTMHPQKRLSS